MNRASDTKVQRFLTIMNDLSRSREEGEGSKAIDTKQFLSIYIKNITD